ncbi:hypothetical protein CJF30_00008985 [Rutstroemia sp. NJR-2017a BBW]|nr:hypothetical protein CJF30_00008985 [Rutstroemia sp. NJR-2017a BBW]
MPTTTPSKSRLLSLHTILHHHLLKLRQTLHLPFPSPPPDDPIEALYTLSPPAFHYLPRSLLLPAHVLKRGFSECSENEPPFLEGRRMQIMGVPKGVRVVIVQFLERGEGDKERRGREESKRTGTEREAGSMDIEPVSEDETFSEHEIRSSDIEAGYVVKRIVKLPRRVCVKVSSNSCLSGGLEKSLMEGYGVRLAATTEVLAEVGYSLHKVAFCGRSG